MTVFGDDAGELNFNRDWETLKHMLTFNGNLNTVEHAGKNFNAPPRRCPGYENAMEIMEFLVERYSPKISVDVPEVSQGRLQEIKGKQSSFQKFALVLGKSNYDRANKFFPTASDVKHPLDTTGRRLGSVPIVAAGNRSIPMYGKMWQQFSDSVSRHSHNIGIFL